MLPLPVCRTHSKLLAWGTVLYFISLPPVSNATTLTLNSTTYGGASTLPLRGKHLPLKLLQATVARAPMENLLTLTLEKMCASVILKTLPHVQLPANLKHLRTDPSRTSEPTVNMNASSHKESSRPNIDGNESPCKVFQPCCQWLVSTVMPDPEFDFTSKLNSTTLF